MVLGSIWFLPRFGTAYQTLGPIAADQNVAQPALRYSARSTTLYVELKLSYV